MLTENIKNMTQSLQNSFNNQSLNENLSHARTVSIVIFVTCMVATETKSKVLALE